MPPPIKAEAVCAIVGDEAAEMNALALSLVERRHVDGRSATFKEPRTVVTDVPALGHVKVTYQICRDQDELVDLNPTVVMMCYTPLDPPTLDDILDVWNPSLDRMYPRPTGIVVGTRVDLLANRKVLLKLRERKVTPVSHEDACEALSRLRLSGYSEVSSASYTGVHALEQAVAKAVLGEPEKRMTPDLVAEMRTACVTAATKKSATWAARRDKQGRLFFVNRMTRKPQWERPDAYDGEEPELTEVEKKAQHEAQFKEAEEKKKNERDREVLNAFMKDLTELGDRVNEFQKREDGLKLQVATHEMELDHIRGRIETNMANRQVLENQRDRFLNNQKDFTKDTVEEDLKMDRDLQNAKAKAFELEAMNALREERDFDVDIAEGVLRNRSLATSLREVLQEQLRTQKSGATSHARTALANKKLEESSKVLLQLRQKVADAKSEKQEMLSSLDKTLLLQKHSELEVSTLTESAADLQFSPLDRHNKERKLVEMCDELDNRLSKLQASMHDPRNGNMKAVRIEIDRLQQEQRSLIISLATVRAQCALMEVRTEKQITVCRHTEGERTRGFEQLLELKMNLLQKQQQTRGSFFKNDGYCPVPRAAVTHSVGEVEMLVSDLSKAHQTSQVRRANQEAQNMYSVLKHKQQLLDQKGEILTEAANRSANTLRNLKQENSQAVKTFEEMMDNSIVTLAEVQQLVSEVDADGQRQGSGTALGSVHGKSALERLRLDSHHALLGNSVSLKILTDTFSQHVAAAKNVATAPGAGSPSQTLGSGPASANHLGHLQSTGAHLTNAADATRSKKAEYDARKLSESVAAEINRDTKNPSVYNTVSLPRSSTPGASNRNRNTWLRN